MSAARKVRRAQRAANRRRAEAAAFGVDGGLGLAAVAAVSALPPGTRRDLEIATWARRAREHGGPIAWLLGPDTTDAELEALVDLQVALEVNP